MVRGSPLSTKQRAATMADVARLAGVSTMTVSRALKGNGAVTAATRSKINAAVDELGYVLDLSAGSLSSKRTGFVSAILPTLYNSNFSDTVNGISEVLGNGGKEILFGYTNYSREREEQLIEAMLRRRPEGIIVTGGTHTPRARQLLETAGVPVVETWDEPADPIDHVVGFSNAATIEDMTARLYFRGYRRIAFIGGDSTDDVRGFARRKGYERAVEMLGLERAHVVPLGPPPITIAHGGPGVARLLQEWPEVEAAICVSDPCAFGAIMECHRNGWPVPERLAVAGFGNFELSRHCWPTITTVAIACTDIGRRSGELILQAIDGQKPAIAPATKSIQIPHSIIERESTGEAASSRKS